MSYANPGGGTPLTGYKTGTQADLGLPNDPVDQYLGRNLTGETGMQNTAPTYSPEAIRNAFTPTRDVRIQQLERERDYLHEELAKAEREVKHYAWISVALGAAAVGVTLVLLFVGVGGAR